MRKAIAYTLAHAVPELLPVGLNLIFDIPLMLPGLLVLLVDIVTEQVCFLLFPPLFLIFTPLFLSPSLFPPSFIIFFIPFPILSSFSSPQVSAISLTYETPERDLMSEPPRNLLLMPLVNLNLILYSYVLVAFFERFGTFCVGLITTFWPLR